MGRHHGGGRFMAKADGPRIGFVEDSGWDTHANEAAILKNKLSELDVGLRAFHEAAQPIWDRTVVVVVSEFGRTAKVNGTGGPTMEREGWPCWPAGGSRGILPGSGLDWLRAISTKVGTCA